MDTFKNDISKVCSKLKKYRGAESKQKEIPFIDTLAGKYIEQNVLEVFAANTEILCSADKLKNDNYDNGIYDMFTKDNMIIFDITADEQVKTPHMSLTQLKKIIFQKLRLTRLAMCLC